MFRGCACSGQTQAWHCPLHEPRARNSCFAVQRVHRDRVAHIGIDALSATLWLATLAALAWGFISIWLSPCHLAGVPLVVGYLAATPQPRANRATLIAAFALGSVLSLAPLGALTIGLGRLAGDLGLSSNLLIAVLCLPAGLYLLRRLPACDVRLTAGPA